MGAKIDGILQKKEASLEQLQGTVAVDAYNVLHQFLSIIRQRDGTALMTSEGVVTSHLSGLFYRSCNLLEKGIKPIYVFDGKPSLLKADTIAQRTERKQDALEKFKKALEKGDEEDMRLYAMQTVRLTKEMVQQSKELLNVLGIPFIEAETEGEAQCAHMNKQGAANATASQDFDSLLFGTPKLIRNLALTGKRKLPRRNAFANVVPETFDLEENLKTLELSQKQLVWIAILSGTDFNKGVYGIGAKKALKLIKKHSDDFEKALEEAGEKIENWREIEKAFLHPKVFDVAKKDVAFKEPDKEKLFEFLVEKYEFSRDRIQSALNRMFSQDLDFQQEGLNKWM
ncbi:MAG: flap endonuclease-1 [Candidatus Micrarchaeia archaeon]